MSGTLADRLAVWSYLDTDSYSRQTFSTFNPSSPNQLQFEVTDLIEEHIRTLYNDYSEWFNLAEYPDVYEQLEASEMPIFLKAAGAPADWTPDLENQSCYEDFDSGDGLVAVIRHRLQQRSPESLKAAIKLYDYLVEFGLFLCDSRYSAGIRMGTLAELAPYLTDRIIDEVTERKKVSMLSESSAPLLDILKTLKVAFECPRLFEIDLAIRIFLDIAPHYLNSD